MSHINNDLYNENIAELEQDIKDAEEVFQQDLDALGVATSNVNKSSQYLGELKNKLIELKSLD